MFPLAKESRVHSLSPTVLSSLGIELRAAKEPVALFGRLKIACNPVIEALYLGVTLCLT
jgi:hypothetical protein